MMRAWRVAIVEKRELERNVVEDALTREAEYYDSKCKAAVAKLTVDGQRRLCNVRQNANRRTRTTNMIVKDDVHDEGRYKAMEASMREAFMRGVLALDEDAFRE
jgi:hypothetical protein